MRDFKNKILKIKYKINCILITTKLGKILYRFIRLKNINSNSKQNLIPKEIEDKKISKSIYQTYKNSDLPNEIKENIKRLKKLNPDWEYKFFDDDEVEKWIKENYGEEILRYYNMINPSYGAARADLFRYLLIYKKGGVYLDIKSTIYKPLDEVLREDDICILSHWDSDSGIREDTLNPLGEYQQWYIISTKGHPYLKMVIENVLRNIKVYNSFYHQTGNMATLRITGPIVYSNTIDSIINSKMHRLVKDKDFGLKYSVFEEHATGKHKVLYKDSNNYTNCTQKLILRK